MHTKSSSKFLQSWQWQNVGSEGTVQSVRTVLPHQHGLQWALHTSGLLDNVNGTVTN
jgi:hypothetical protein